MTDTKKLREAAERATPWDADDHGAASEAWHQNKENNAAFCRLANPQTVLSLLDELEQLKGTIECDRGDMRLEIKRADNNFDACELLAGEVKQLQEQLRKAKDELDAARGAVEMLAEALEEARKRVPSNPISNGVHMMIEFALSHPTVQAARAK